MKSEVMLNILFLHLSQWGSSRLGCLVLLSRSSLGASSMGSTRALAVAPQTWWPQPLARVLAMARWRSWNRELEKAEAEEQAELEKQRAIMEFDPAHLY